MTIKHALITLWTTDNKLYFGEGSPNSADSLKSRCLFFIVQKLVNKAIKDGLLKRADADVEASSSFRS